MTTERRERILRDRNRILKDGHANGFNAEMLKMLEVYNRKLAG